MDIDKGYKDAEKLLLEAISSDAAGNRYLNGHEGFYLHSAGVGEMAYMKAKRLLANGADNDPKLVHVSGLLHDIGKVVASRESWEMDPSLIFDSIHGYEYLMKMGHPEVAKTIFPSFTLKEMMEMEPKIFPDYVDYQLEPKTWEQKLIVYGDAHVDGNGYIVSFDERMEDIRSRYPSDSLLIKSIDSGGEERLRKICREIDFLTM